MKEKEILCDIIQNYIEIANNNDNVLDDSISVISLIYQFERQYSSYKDKLDDYLKLFEERGILKKYFSNSTNVAKIYFTKYGTNPEFVENNIFGFIEKCSSRFMFYLIMVGLVGKPNTSQQRYLLSTIFERNSYCFNKEMIYYGNLYINNKPYLDNIKKDIRYGNVFERIKLFKTHKQNIYNTIGLGYEIDKDFKNAFYYYNKAKNKKKILLLCLKFKEYKIGINYIQKKLNRKEYKSRDFNSIIIKLINNLK